ncbi:Histidine ammonia-lyase [Mucinivorans hirudinis]|uniref:Histidine ammonia-lyase n=1 Tax=Mucinivorans hirudinis TaxID=1433126 RepID=A0A060R714_9BACT|nr:Histidine ammonia-lyase [Mucinivorans hirudinis]
MIHYISSENLTIERVCEIVEHRYKLALSDEARHNIATCRQYLDNKMESQIEPIYGITTGFGSLCNVSVSKADLSQLQYNLVVSHACGTGEEVDGEIVRLMLFLKIQSLSYGYSGVQVATVERLIAMFNEDVLPVVYEQGSLGASGDLAPLAHLSLPLLGLGEVFYKEKKQTAAAVNEQLGWQPIALQSKEGLALLNGTQFMSAYASYVLSASERLSRTADFLAALSLDAFEGRLEPFDERVHKIRHHRGQITTAAVVRKWLEGSELMAGEKKNVQDPYSFRCVPQVHGATKDTIDYLKYVVANEINSVTDNPNIFYEDDIIISGGNFHGQPLAYAMDFIAIAIAELASISGQRIYQLINGKRGLPPFLVANPGLNSGFMIPQYTAASIISQNKQLCMPSSVDSIESSGGQEDHVSMGANAATKALRVMRNTERVLAIEMFNAAQALEFRRPKQSSPRIESIVAKYRNVVPFVEQDEVMYPLIERSIRFIRENL